jgi:hypothetical protein
MALNRAQWQQLAEERLLDAAALLKAHRWSAAYYLSGYALECGLKSSVLHYLEKTGIIFLDRKYLKDLGDCWTHDLVTLVRLAGLIAEQGIAFKANPAFLRYWGDVTNWSETSRYEQKSEAEAKALYEAITHDPDGVLRWIRIHW